MDHANFRLEVIYATSMQQHIIPIWIAPGTTAHEAILQSGILTLCPEIELNMQPIGCFGRIINLNQPLNHGDRVEIYHPLLIDPKLARKQRVKRQKQQFQAAATRGKLASS